MAKHRKRRGRKAHRRSRVNAPKTRRSRRAKAPIFKMQRRRRGRKGRRRSFTFRRVSRRSIKRGNPPSIGGGWFRIPTMQELLWVGVGSLGLPTVNRFVTNLIPLDAVKSGYGNIATEFLIGAVASGAARKYAGSNAGDILFTLVLARAVGRTAFAVSGGLVGFAEADEAGQMSFYQPDQLGYTGPLPGFGDGDEAESPVNV